MSSSLPVRILIIDSDEESYHHTRHLISELPEETYITEHITNYNDALQAIKSDAFDIYLVDVNPDSSGKSGIDLIRESASLGVSAPYVLMTRNADEISSEEVFENGVMDILDKNKLSPKDFRKTLQFCLKHARNMTEARQRNAELVSIVRDRTRELHHRMEELKQSRMETLAALESEKDLHGLRARLLLMVMHEFRTPFATILSSADLILNYTRTEEQPNRKKHVDRIKKSLNNLTIIVDDFLLLDYVDHDSSAPRLEPIDISELCGRVILEVKSFSHSEIEINCVHAETVPVVNIDPRLLGTVMRHLLLNSIKFTLQNQPITITTNVIGTSLRITISDSGIGIPQADQKYIFDRFFRASNALNIPGTGIGLNLIAAYIQKMNGSISFVSTENVGTTFTLEFPDCVALV